MDLTQQKYYKTYGLILGGLFIAFGFVAYYQFIAPQKVATIAYRDDTMSSGSSAYELVADDFLETLDESTGDLLGSIEEINTMDTGDTGSTGQDSLTIPQYDDDIEVAYRGLLSGSMTLSGFKESQQLFDELSTVYGRKIEQLISVKGQDTRMSMLITMNKFIKRYPESHPLYKTINQLIDIVKLGEVAHNIATCNQFNDTYTITLFGMKVDITSSIKYDSNYQKCSVSYTYPDNSTHTCLLDKTQQSYMSAMITLKQGLSPQLDNGTILESLIDSYVNSGVCKETQISNEVAIITNTGSDITGTGTTKKGFWNGLRGKFK